MRAGFHKKKISLSKIIDITQSRAKRAVSKIIKLSHRFLIIPIIKNCKIPKAIATAIAVLGGKILSIKM